MGSKSGTMSTVVPARSSAQSYSLDVDVDFDRADIDADSLVLQEVVGVGVTAEVHKGLYKGDFVAVKRFKNLKAMNQKYVDREIQLLLRLNHPNIVRLCGFCRCPQGVQLVAEFCQGGTLFSLLHMSEVDLVYSQQTKMCLDIATGMRYLHEQTPPIVHRDLKSLNLLLKRPVQSCQDVPEVQVTDFGLSRIAEAGSFDDGTMTKGVGTIQWMAPECISSSTYDLTIDVFSYGVCVFEVMAQEPPYDELDEGTDVKAYVLNGGRPDLDAVPPDTPQAIYDLMEECWAADHRRRPSFGQICERLARAQREPCGEPITLLRRLSHSHELQADVPEKEGAGRRLQPPALVSGKPSKMAYVKRTAKGLLPQRGAMRRSLSKFNGFVSCLTGRARTMRARNY
jgi:serine/threonine protein kinase